MENINRQLSNMRNSLFELDDAIFQARSTRDQKELNKKRTKIVKKMNKLRRKLTREHNP